MKNKFIFLLLIIIIAAAYFFVFKNFFFWNKLSFGDSPNFSDNLIKTYSNLPQVWRSRGAPLGGVSIGDLTLSLLMYFYGLLGKAGLENGAIVKSLFLFPSTFLAIFASYSLLGYFVKDKSAKLVGTVLYTFNTYFLLLVDGGQVGVALGYGFAPLVLLFFIKTFERFTFRNFILSFTLFWLLTNVEIRFALIVVFAFLVYAILVFLQGGKRGVFKSIAFLIPILIFATALNSFWLVPLLLTKVNLPDFFTELELTNLMHTFFLYQPHWPLNEFGRVSNPALIYTFLPIVLFSPLVFTRNKKVVLMCLAFVIFAFLAKGTNSPLGEIYRILLNLPFGDMFRDSTKFFLPLMLFASILVAFSTEELMQRYKKFPLLIPLSITFYLLFLIRPAIVGDLSGLLVGKIQDTTVYDEINREIEREKKPYRFLFFPARSFYIKETYPNEILNGNDLYKKRPFATLIEGTYDKFFFLWDPIFPKLLDFTGVKNIYFNPDPRKKTYSANELEEREEFLSKVSQQPFGKQLSDYHFPAFEREDVTPRFISVEKIVLVFGQDDIYSRLFAKSNLRLDEFPIIFAEDGTWPIENLLKVDINSLSIIFYNKDPKDLIYRILAEGNTISLKNLLKTNWGKAEDTINWRNEAGKRGIVTHDFDLGKGVLFSSIPGEKTSYTFYMKEAGEKNIVIRGLGINAKVGVLINGENVGEIIFRETDGFTYQSAGQVNLSKGRHSLTIENLQGFSMINLIELFSDEEYDAAEILADKLLNTFPQITPKASPIVKPQIVEFIQEAPTKYRIGNINNSWIIFTESYHPGWRLNNNEPFPVFSLANAFYIKGDKEATLYFTPEDFVKKGLKLSFISAIIIVGVMVSFYVGRKKIEKLLN